jgi:CheY-like chemotaxis protein
VQALLLEVTGHEAHSAHVGLTARERTRAFQPEVVLRDIGLPGMNGYKVARRLRQEPGRGRWCWW